MGGLAAADAALRAEVALASAAAGGSDGRSDGGSVGCSAGGAVTAVPSAAVTTEDEHGEGGGTESVDISGSAPAAATLTPTDTRYALSGVVVHSGMANAGHYYSYIRVRDAPGHEGPNHGKWWVPGAPCLWPCCFFTRWIFLGLASPYARGNLLTYPNAYN